MQGLPQPIEIICLGRSSDVGVLFAHHLAPRVFMTHFFSPSDNPAPRITAILSTSGCRVKAIIAGGAYPAAERDEARRRVEEAAGTKRVPWLLAAASGSGQSGGATGPPSAAAWDEMTKAASKRMVDLLEKMEADGSFGQLGTFHY